ncbi:MAG TPA: CbtA family protein [Alphaproteobacteria bacterium]|nr:CbtA family protein [Alphaproteobacteria bacterium]
MLAAILFRAVQAGLAVGLIVAVVHQLWTVPLILRAETYERAAETSAPGATAHDHDAAHDHDDGGWKPAKGFERIGFTALADILTAIGFALLLSGAYVLSGRDVAWREGIVWGLAGFAAFALAPSLGLPPALPGMPETALGPRQAWWIATAALTAAGLALLFLHRRPWSIGLAVLLIAAPHLWGAPPPSTEASAVPASLWRSFVIAATATNLLSWVLLGALTGYLHQRDARRDARELEAQH